MAQKSRTTSQQMESYNLLMFPSLSVFFFFVVVTHLKTALCIRVFKVTTKVLLRGYITKLKRDRNNY